MLRVVVAAPPDVVHPDDLARLPASADLVELRLDLLQAPRDVEGLAAWIAAAPRPVLATVRSVREGGAFSGGADAAAAWLATAAEAGAAWIDAEDDVLPRLAGLPEGVRVVASRHGARLGDEDAPPPGAWAVRKRAGPLLDAADLERFRAALRPAPARGRAHLPTGPLAALRVLDARAALTYGSGGTPVVAGQPTLEALLDELRSGEVGPDAALFGLLGAPPAWSPTPALHNAVFRALGRDAVCVPLPGLAFADARALPFRGFAVTTPFKAAAWSACPGAAPEARPGSAPLGAWNTLVRAGGDDGALVGLNSDVAALERCLPHPAEVGPRRVVVFGAGGYARAALHVLRARGQPAGVVARDGARGRALAAAFGAADLGARWTRAPEDLALLNATPAGASGEPVPALDGDLAGLVVLDAPYAAEDGGTWLATQARARGAGRTVDGLELLLAQAGAQAAAFAATALGAASLDLSTDRLDAILRLALRPRTSLVLVGLRAAGKTTVGRALARHLGRPFVDLDDEVLRLTGRSAAAWLEGQGVEAFRLVEARAVAGLAGRRGLVVATGGGALERRENAARLAALGLVAWLDVTPEVSAARRAAEPGARPALVPGADPLEEARRLKARRDPQYAALARLRLDAARPVVALVTALAGEWAGLERDLRRIQK